MVHAQDPLHEGAVVGSIEFHSPVDVVEAVSAVTPVLVALGVATIHAEGVAVLARRVAHSTRGPIGTGVLTAISATVRQKQAVRWSDGGSDSTGKRKRWRKIQMHLWRSSPSTRKLKIHFGSARPGIPVQAVISVLLTQTPGHQGPPAEACHT